MPVSQRVIAAVLSSQRGSSSGGGPAPEAPANTVAPAVTGTATVGQTLSCTTGTWTGTATIVYTYQWQRAGVNIGSATSSTYLLVDADYGSAIRCVVTGTNGVGNASANSNATAAVVRTYSQEVLADTPAGYWKLDETSGTNAADSSGNALSGTHASAGGSGIPLVNQTPLITNGKSVLYGRVTNTGQTTVAHNALLNFGNTFTYEVWLKPATLAANMGLMSKVLNAYVTSGGAVGVYNTVGGVLAQSANSLVAAGSTYHFVYTKSSTTNKLYLNGVDVTGSTSNETLVNTGAAFVFGQEAGSFFDGNLDEVAVYSTALSGARIAAHYAARTR